MISIANTGRTIWKQSRAGLKCAAMTKPDKPLDAFATLIHYYNDKLALMVPVCLAMNPLSVLPYIADVSKNKMQDGSRGLFAKNGNGANKRIYDEVVRIMGNILFELKKMAREVDKGVFSLDEIIVKLPHELTIMKPPAIFLRTLAVLAKRRRQKINLAESVRFLENKLTTFGKGQKFLKTTRYAYNTNYLCYNPFLEW